MNFKKKILFVVPNLSAGGAEKVMSFVAQNLDASKFSVKLIVIGFKKDSVYNTANVDTIYLNKNHVRNAFFSLIKKVRHEKPHIILSSIGHLNSIVGLIAFLFPKIVCIGRETFVRGLQQNIPNNKSLRYFLFSLITKISYRGLQYIMCQSQDMEDDMVKNKGIPLDKIITINNPISQNFTIKSTIPEYSNGYQFITIGRLAKPKGHERILRILSKIKYPFSYTIIGDGPEKDNLIEKIKLYNMKDKIKHIPYTNNVREYLSESHFYLQGSYFEGFPNALIESIAVGTPAIVFDAPGGINEIMVSGENGQVAKNDTEFLDKLNESIEQINHFTPERVSKFVKKQFNSEKIISKYEAFFQTL